MTLSANTPFDRVLKIMIKPWVAISFFAFVMFAFFYIDQPLADYFHNLDFKKTLPFLALLSWLTKLGLGSIYLLGFLVIALFFRYIHKNRQWEARSWFLWLCILIPSTICLCLKVCLGRARPRMLFDGQWYGFYGFKTNPFFWSFPSGHTTTIIGLVFGLSILFPRYGYAFIFSGLMVASSRILLIHHYLSDVLATSYLTLLEIGGMLYWLRCKSLSRYFCFNSDSPIQ